MFTPSIPGREIGTKRLRFNGSSGTWVSATEKKLFLKGPVPLGWLSAAASLPGKALHLGVALWWLQGMSKTPHIKVTKKALHFFALSRDATRDGLLRLENKGLIRVQRSPGQRPRIWLIPDPADTTDLDPVLESAP
jgi:hypothetical protein